jgi:hypothetical protein
MYVSNHTQDSHCSRDKMTRNRLTTMSGSDWTEISITSPYSDINFTTSPASGTGNK